MRARSVSSNIIALRRMSAFHTWPPCASSTPLGLPVEPDVYGCMQISSGSVGRRARAGEAAASSASYAWVPSRGGPSTMTCLRVGRAAASAAARSAMAALAISTVASASSTT